MTSKRVSGFGGLGRDHGHGDIGPTRHTHAISPPRPRARHCTLYHGPFSSTQSTVACRRRPGSGWPSRRLQAPTAPRSAASPHRHVSAATGVRGLALSERAWRSSSGTDKKTMASSPSRPRSCWCGSCRSRVQLPAQRCACLGRARAVWLTRGPGGGGAGAESGADEDHPARHARCGPDAARGAPMDCWP